MNEKCIIPKCGQPRTSKFYCPDCTLALEQGYCGRLDKEKQPDVERPYLDDLQAEYDIVNSQLRYSEGE